MDKWVDIKEITSIIFPSKKEFFIWEREVESADPQKIEYLYRLMRERSESKYRVKTDEFVFYGFATILEITETSFHTFRIKLKINRNVRVRIL